MIKIKWAQNEIPNIQFGFFERLVLWLAIKIGISNFTLDRGTLLLSCVKGVNTDTKKVFVEIYDWKATSNTQK